MKRETLRNAARTVANDLRETGVAEMFQDILQKIRPGSKEERATETVSFAIFQALSVRAQKYGPAEH